MNELKDNKQKWELLYEYIVTMEFGSMITHFEISGTIDEPENTQKYYSIVNRAKKALLESGKAIKPIHGQGYKILNPNDYTDESISKFKQGARCITKGTKLLENAPINHMDKDELQRYRSVSDRARILHASIQGACTEVKLLGKKNHPLLPENIRT